jgi:hypothetical protein
MKTVRWALTIVLGALLLPAQAEVSEPLTKELASTEWS